MYRTRYSRSPLRNFNTLHQYTINVLILTVDSQLISLCVSSSLQKSNSRRSISHTNFFDLCRVTNSNCLGSGVGSHSLSLLILSRMERNCNYILCITLSGQSLSRFDSSAGLRVRALFSCARGVSLAFGVLLCVGALRGPRPRSPGICRVVPVCLVVSSELSSRGSARACALGSGGSPGVGWSLSSPLRLSAVP